MDESLGSVLEDNRSLGSKAEELGHESTWIAASQQGDGLAFNRLVLRWEKPIFNLALRMLQDMDEAAEATQDVFLSAFKNIRRFRQDARFSTWLYRIAVNHCISRLRRKPPGVHCSLDDPRPGGQAGAGLPSRESHEQEFLQAESRNRVRLAMERLPPEQRAVVELKFYHDLTFEEIAAIVEAPLSTIKSRLYAGLEILKVRLGGP
jgi:RNA polymerase sigma-70 factor (ECF subfamily)